MSRAQNLKSYVIRSYMLNEVRPVILCEVGSQSAEQITRILTSASYRLLDGEKIFKRRERYHASDLEHGGNT